MAVTSNLKTYEPFADIIRATPMFDLAGMFDFPRARYGYPTRYTDPEPPQHLL